MNWMNFVILTTTVEQVINQYLNYRQLQKLKIKTIPSTLEAYNITTPEQFAKSQQYGYDKFSATNFLSNFGYSNEILISIVFLTEYILFSTLLEIPFSLYYSFVLEEKHGFNKISLKLFIKDKIIGVLLIVVIGGPLVSALIYIVKWTGPLFWFYSWLLIAAFSFVMITIYPVLIAPLFNKYSPVEGELRDSIYELAKKVDFPATQLYVVDNSKRSSHMNAYFYGFFKNKRIVLYDTLIKELSQEEILAVLCHEFGHYKMNHTLRLIVIQQIYLIVFFYIFGLFVNDIQLFNDFGFQNTYTFVGLLLFSQIYSPLDQIFSFISNVFSRAYEYQADDYALGMGYDLTDGLVKLNIKDSASLIIDPWYSTYHHTHPTLLERLKNIKSKLSTSKKTQ
ncbi:CAAX prenyl protease [Heterostelium album PN500]|uniref:CAAX prenyl protease n=1 Tax=Heterostelium pallidum (strain ATCC 26659 / Pp 5 / PN500) TaxID=670386 RepID=D3BVF2_HETP5|nr:CAAX prenyl protease [Heterostelium album PN500]EFA74575.1 CAAX prenyl protease [Heterostelium album PN500]|eukprot:XP_020426709.1 CAAX prenyl protease [Heterostelium album PN500]